MLSELWAEMPKPMKWLLGATVAIGCLWGGLKIRAAVKAHQVETHVQQADQHHEAAVTAAAQGATHEQEAAARKPVLASNAAEVARLQAKVDALQAALKPTAPVLEPLPGVPPVDLAPLVAGQQELIGALKKENGDLKAQVLTLALRGDSYKTAYEQSAQVELQLRSALAAQQGLAKAQRWLGSVEGFAVGVGSGYIAGRLK